MPPHNLLLIQCSASAGGIRIKASQTRLDPAKRFAYYSPMGSEHPPTVASEGPDVEIARRLDELARRLENSWTRETSADPVRWSAENSSFGQCAVTALIVQDHFGGELLRARVNGVSHYWNRLPFGLEVDLTRKQFGVDPDVPPGEVKSREFVISFPETVDRYLSLRRALGVDTEPVSQRAR